MTAPYGDPVLIPRFEPTADLLAPDAVTVVGVTSGDDGPTVLGGDAVDALRPLVAPLRVSAKPGAVTRGAVAADGALAPVAFVGLGAAADAAAWRDAAAVARACADDEAVVIVADDLDDELAEAIATGFALGAYRFDTYRSAPAEGEDEVPTSAPALRLLAGSGASFDEAFRRARAVVSAVWLARDLVNTPPNDLSPDALARAAAAAAESAGVRVTTWEEEDLRRDGFGGLLAVGAGSSRPPRLVRLDWEPENPAARVALVGKGITFDSGGLSLKPAASMVHMKSDMAGAAAVLAVVTTLASLESPVAVSGWLCLAENMPSGTATRPDDVITIRGGTTVEVTNTDAEGRLVLADGIVAASETHPDVVIDIATLTGAQVIALGDRTTGLMGNDEEWMDRVLAGSVAAGEPAWPMPIPAELGPVLASDVADVANARPGKRAAGMLLAAWFLRRFVGDREDGSGAIPWVHLDIAGPSMNDGSPYGVTPRGATGVMVRSLVGAISSLAEARDASAGDDADEPAADAG